MAPVLKCILEALSLRLSNWFFAHTQNSDTASPKISPPKDWIVCWISVIHLSRFTPPTLFTLLCVLGRWIWTISMPLWLPLRFTWLEAPAGGHGLPLVGPFGLDQRTAPVRGPSSFFPISRDHVFPLYLQISGWKRHPVLTIPRGLLYT